MDVTYVEFILIVILGIAVAEELSRAFSPATPTSAATALQPSFVRRLMEGLKRLAGENVYVASPVLLYSTPARFHLKRLLERFVPQLVVLSPGEIRPVIQVQTVGILR